MPERDSASPREPLALLVLAAAALAASAVGPRDRTTWWLEAAPVLIAAPLLIVTWRRFPLTALAYRLIFLHALVLLYGAHYTYAQTPFGFWLQELLGIARNPYDRLGHLMQGIVPALIAREILLRRSPLVRGKWLFFLVCCVVLAVSAAYEFLEWWGALALGQQAEAFLAMQGDPWDTQWDMFLALIGAVLAQALLARRHDRELAALPLSPPRQPV
jgi:putative membrane protein